MKKKWLAEGYRKIFVPSNIAKNDFVENHNINPDDIIVAYPGVDEREALAPSGNKVFCFGLSAVGFKRKGGYIFINALKLLKKRGLRFKAKIIYSKKNRWLDFLVDFYGLKNNVEFLTFQNEMADFYKSIDCLVVPSIEDTFAMTVTEAMVMGRPAIVSSNAGASEIIEDGKDGFVFQMDKTKEKNLADKMEYIIKNYSEELCKNARNKALTLTWDRFFNDFKTELEKLR